MSLVERVSHWTKQLGFAGVVEERSAGRCDVLWALFKVQFVGNFCQIDSADRVNARLQLFLRLIERYFRFFFVW